jgi:hypothetical protein
MKGSLLLASPALVLFVVSLVGCGERFNHQLAHEEKVEQSLAALDARLSAIEGKLAAIDAKLSTIEQKLAKDPGATGDSKQGR